MQAPTIALISPGAMGAAIGARLIDGGARVLTSLEGRGAASRARANAAGMIAVADAELVAADLILSVVPPAEAEALAQRLLPHIAARAAKPLYCDLNACNPATKRRIAALLEVAGCRMVDGGIIGPPPQPGAHGTTIYLAGPDAPAALALRDHGLAVQILDGPIGAASALKMSYAGINKGLVGLGAAMLLGANRSGAGPALHAEMMASMPDLVRRFERQIPDMYRKAWRWAPEMREIAGFLTEDPAAAMMFEGLAQLFERLAADRAGSGREQAALDALVSFRDSPEPK